MHRANLLTFFFWFTSCEGVIRTAAGVEAPLPDVTPADACASVERERGTWPLQRLTSLQLQRTATRVLGDDTHAYADRLGGTDEVLDPRLRYALAVSANPVVAEGLMLAGEDVSIAAAPRFPCSAPDAAGERACAADVAAQQGRLLWRRTLAAGELDTVLGSYDATRLAGGAHADGVQALLHALLAAPDFFFVQQPKGEPGAGGALKGTRLAERLAFTLWLEAPDTALLDAAESGALETPEGFGAQLDRMLADPRAAEALSDFLNHWLSPEKTPTVTAALAQATRHPQLYPEFAPPSAPGGGDGPAFMAALDVFLSRAARPDTGTFLGLMTSDELVVNDAVARNLGLPAVAAGATEVRGAETRRRRGVLGQPAMLTAFGRFESSDPVHRGVFLLRHALCAPLPSPDANVNTTLPEPGSVKTTRDRFTAPTQAAACAGCHGLINPLGFSFENFDAVGRFRDVENGAPVDATATLPAAVDAQRRQVDGLAELSAALARMPEVRACVARQLASWALHRTLSTGEACAVRDAAARFTEGDGAFRELLGALVRHPSFNAPVLP